MRRGIVVISFIILHAILTTSNYDNLDLMIYRYTGLPPYWHPEYLEMYRWNRLVKKYGVKTAMVKYERSEYE